MKEELRKSIEAAVKDLFGAEVSVELARPAEQFGDYATNVALQLAAKLNKTPSDVASQLADKLRNLLTEQVSEVSIASPGFINLKLNDEYLLSNMLDAKMARPLKGQEVVAEYSDPNPFKVLHAGHLYTSIVGDAIANLLEHAGATVHRVNFGGDVGLHVARTLWAADRRLKGDLPQKYNDRPIEERAQWMADCYVEGSRAYEKDENAKQAIVRFNKLVYEVHAKQDYTSYLAQVYWMCREWSYEYFRWFYKRIGTEFEKFYAESEVTELGMSTVKQQMAAGVYEQSDGAIVFRGEKYGLHTRVFINSDGLPTYEAKDVGLAIKKYEDYHPDKSIIITGNEQEEYMAVVQKSIELFAPQLLKGSMHLTHGMVRLAGGEKMASRKGNVLRATDVIEAAAAANKEILNNEDDFTTLGAVKYAFLKQRLGGDIIYDPKESVSLEGNSGPYLQYAHARAQSILVKVADNYLKNDILPPHTVTLQPGERSLARKISEYPEVIDRAVAELVPHQICAYLYELAQTFNRFYEQNRVIGDERQTVRLYLVEGYAEVLKKGLGLLGIAAPNNL